MSEMTGVSLRRRLDVLINEDVSTKRCDNEKHLPTECSDVLFFFSFCLVSFLFCMSQFYVLICGHILR